MTKTLCVCGHDKASHGAGKGWCMHLGGNSHECLCSKFVEGSEKPLCTETLQTLMGAQRGLQIRIKKNLGQTWPETLAEMDRCMQFTAVAIADEAHEVLHTTTWKGYRKQEFNPAEAKKELIDVLNFCLNGFNDLGVDATEVVKLFYEKLTINHYRQDKLEEGDPV